MCFNAESLYAEVFTLSGFMLSVFMLIALALCVDMLSIVILSVLGWGTNMNVIVMNVVAPVRLSFSS